MATPKEEIQSQEEIQSLQHSERLAIYMCTYITHTCLVVMQSIVLDESKLTIDEGTSGEYLPNIVQGMCILFQLHKSCHELNITQIPTAHCLFSNSKALQSTINLGQFTKPVVRILVVRLTGHGKSSLINAMLKEDVAPVEHGASSCKHDEYIMEYKLSQRYTYMTHRAWGMLALVLKQFLKL